MTPIDPKALEYAKFQIINLQIFQEMDIESQMTFLKLIDHSVRLYLEGLLSKNDNTLQ